MMVMAINAAVEMAATAINTTAMAMVVATANTTAAVVINVIDSKKRPNM